MLSQKKKKKFDIACLHVSISNPRDRSPVILLVHFYIKANISQQTITTDFPLYSLILNPELTIFVHSFIALKITAIAQVEKEQSEHQDSASFSISSNKCFLVYKTH